MATSPETMQTAGVSLLNRTIDGVLAVRQAAALGKIPDPEILQEAEDSIVDALVLMRWLKRDLK